MRANKIISFVIAALIMASFGACASNEQPSNTGTESPAETQEAGEGTQEPEAVVDAPMQYISREELKYAITAIQGDYVILDVRKQQDFQDSHIINAVSADVDAAREGDDDSGIANLSAALKSATGSATGKPENTIVLLCYSGAGYAQKATDLLITMGVDSNSIYTLEGGYKGWTEDDPEGQYQYLIDVAENESEFASSLFKPEREGDLYLDPDEVKALYEAEQAGSDGDKISDYYIMDARFESEYEDSHLATAVHSATFAAASGAAWVPREQVIQNIRNAFDAYPYEDGQKILIVCTGGRGGAQLLDDVLREEFDIDNDLMYTLRYGYGAFDESWAKQGQDYMQYVKSGSEPGTVE